MKSSPLELAKRLREGDYLSHFGDMLYLKNGKLIESRWENVPEYPTIVKAQKGWKEVHRELKSGKWY